MFTVENVSLTALVPYENNPRLNDKAVEAVANSIKEFGFNVPIVIDKNNVIIAGHTRYKASKKLGLETVPCYRAENLNEEQVKAFRLVDNKTAELAEWDFSKLEEELLNIDFDMSDFGFDFEEEKVKNDIPESIPLAERFVVPPLSVLDTRQGYWQDRKREWKAIGLKSEVGRDANLLKALNNLSEKSRSGKRIAEDESVFDPFLCEILYTWFAKKGYKVLDPFAGGSVRGIVASVCGLEYTGIDLREEQVQANREQLHILNKFDGLTAPTWIIGDSDNMDSLLEEDYQTDFVFSCPPYFDLEVYSKLENDLSNMSVDDFAKTYKSIIKKACSRLKENRFACFVIGENRNKQGNYNNLLGLTIDSFIDSGLSFYNEISLINQVGSKSLTCAESMNKSRKVGKCHQNVLVFVKGDGRKATEELGEIKAKKITIS